MVVDAVVGPWEEECDDDEGRLARGLQGPVQAACDRVQTMARLIGRDEKSRCWF